MSSDVHHSGDQEEAHKCPVSDNEDSPVGERSNPGTTTNSRRLGQWLSTHYQPNLKSMFRCSDYSRPLASKEDTVVYYKKGDVGLAHVHRLDRRKLDNKLYKGLISCQTLELETIPTCRRVCRLVEETFVIDRGFSVGETVIKYENEFAGNPDKEYLCMPRLETAIGQVVNVEVRGDVLVLPQKNLVVKNVPLGGNEYTEMVNYNSAHNYVMYKDWIGNASDCVNEVTLVYRGRHRFVVKEGGRSGVYLRRQDHADDGKALVPGECVSISVSEAIGRSATWENGPPKTLTASRRRRGVDSVKCVIEKIETHSIIVDWITSPSSTKTPPKTIPKQELSKITRIDPSANPRPNTCDRVKVIPDGMSTVSTFKEFFADLTEQYGSRFQKLNAREVEALSTPCENCSKALQRELKQSTATAKAAKIARLSDYSPEQTKESECVSSRGPPSSEVPEAQGDAAVVDGTTDSSHDSSEDNDIPSNCGKSRVSVCRSIVRQKRTRKYPNRRRRCTPSLPVGCSRLAKDILGDGFIGEVLLSSTLVDVQWMDGTIERQIPGYMLIPHDPDLDQQDHLPGVIVARKDVQNAESTFGLILSTNRSERSCVVLWFERKENSVKSLGEEECLLFDIMPHPAYKRLFIGNYGFVIDQHHPSNDMRDIAFQVVADLNNGKQRVKFLNGREEELWPFDILPIHFVDESLDSDSDESSSITEVSTLDETTSSPLSTKNISNVLKSLGLFDDEDDRKNDVGKQTPVKGAVATLLKSFPELDNFSKKCSPRDVDAHTVQILFAGCVLKASGKSLSLSVESLILFADVMTAFCRSQLLPDNFNMNQLSSLVDDYENHKVFDKFLYPNEHHVRQRHEIIASSLIEARQASRDHPELLAIFHCVTERLRNYKECGVRPPLRSKLHEFANSTSGFKPRHLSWEYIQSVADELLAIYCDEGSDPGPSKTKRKRASSGTSASSELPTFMLNLQATEREMAQGVDRTKLVISLIAQIMELPTSVMNKADSFTLYPNKDFATSHVPIEDRTNEAYNRKRIHTLASAVVLLHRCGLLNYNTFREDSIWKGVNCIYSDKYVAPSFIEYPTLHEIIAYVRSVDFHDPTPLKQLSIFTNTYSFDLIHSQVTEAYSKKMEEIGNTSNVNCNTFNEKERTVAAVPVAKQDTNKGTFMVLDECPAGGDSSDFAPSRKFYATVFKEHKMLTEHVPDSIHVHAFASRLNVIHVLIVGPSGTPFDCTPFYFTIKLPSDYPEKPPEVTYVAYSQEQLNPNLYQSGKVCTSLLGTWSGQGVETWNPSKSNLLQVLLSIQALILVPEPYYNEAGYESRKQQTEMADRSKRYNETATINSLEYLLKIYKDPPSDFKELVKEIVENEWPGLRSRVQGWIDGSHPPLFPVMNSKGFKMALEKAITRMDAQIKPYTISGEEPMEVGDSNIEPETQETIDENPGDRLYEWSIVVEPRKTGKSRCTASNT
ncbi:hypothetical protein Y032_0334g2831 [Ancylostoma ceylanicum]|uniref:UBC core domain-containing protein n=1 Tax=Ancylostoma ceylanicum TaxID=53326 RepID=A0A016RYQ4_9BILA|nr:hypothetical protein Y032_0334g2831 [Ancylostoma ceylanicum]